MNFKILLFLFSYTCLIFGSPLSVSEGGTGLTAITTTYGVLCGGTSNINPLQTIASLGTSGYPLVSNGSNNLPSFQAPLTFAGGGTGVTSISTGIVQSDGSTLSSLGIGSANQVLKNTAGTAGWALTGVLQIVVASTSAAISTTGTSIPDDDTIPQSGEGTQILTQAFTPKSASSNLLIIFAIGGTANLDTAGIAALFVDSTASALAAAYIGQRPAGDAYSSVMQYKTTSSSTTSRTYKIRVGGGNFQVNASSAGAARFNSTASTCLIIIEYI